MNFKRVILAALLVMIVCASFLIGCIANTESRVSVGSKPGETMVTFPDSNLEMAVSRQVGKPSEDIESSEVERLTFLEIRGDDLRGLEHCTNLTNLIVFGAIEDFSPLAGLHGLIDLTIIDLNKPTALGFANDPIMDITPLATLINLRRLSIWNYPIGDISAIGNLVKLESLTINNARITDVSPLAGLALLQELHLCGNRIGNLEPLAGLTSLRKLDIQGNSIECIAPLSSLVTLTELRLDENRISDISAISALRELTSLGLSMNRISDIASLSELTNLASLSLSDNQISDIRTLCNLTNLNDVYLSNNWISDISPLLGLSEKLRPLVVIKNNPLNKVSLDQYVPELYASGVRILTQ